MRPLASVTKMSVSVEPVVIDLIINPLRVTNSFAIYISLFSLSKRFITNYKYYTFVYLLRQIDNYQTILPLLSTNILLLGCKIISLE